MVTLARAVIAYVRALFVPRHKLALEAAALTSFSSVLLNSVTELGLRRTVTLRANMNNLLGYGG